eukprot:1175626-Amphidinium_carterae.1
MFSSLAFIALCILHEWPCSYDAQSHRPEIYSRAYEGKERASGGDTVSAALAASESMCAVDSA